MKSIFCLLCFATLFFVACEDPIQLGAGLVDGEVNDPEFTDTFGLVAKIVEGDPPITFRNSVNFNNATYLVGAINDPVFGRYSSVAFFDSYIATSFPPFDNIKIDSVIMVLGLDSLSQYGDPSETHNIEVYQLEERLSIDGGDTLFSDLNLAYGSALIGSFTGKISSSDSLTIFNPASDTLIRVKPQLRIPLDTTLWSSLARDTSVNQNNEDVGNYLRGFAVRSVNAQNSIIGVLLDGADTRVDYYYTLADTAKAVFSMFNGLNRHSFFEHDYTASPVEEALQNINAQDFLYLQGMAGVNIEFDLAPLLALGDSVVVNNAILELTAETPEGIYPPVRQLLASYYNEDGVLFVIEDVAQSSSFAFFDGGLEEVNIGGTKYSRYEMNITSHLNNMLDGSIDQTKIIVSVSSTQSQARRSIIYGPESPIQPAKLKLIITKP